MSDFVWTAAAMKLGYGVVAALALVFFTVWLDRRAKVDFKAMIDQVAANPMAAAVYFGLRFLAIALLIGLLVGCAAAQARTFPVTYDRHIKSAVARYWPDFPDWLMWKAQLWQESTLNPHDVSEVGAAGLAQFMPATWREVSAAIGAAGARPDSDVAIDAGAYYMTRMRRMWLSRTDPERHRFAEASYNAGAGWIMKAAARCPGPWAEVGACLVQFTGKANAKQTNDYVTRIEMWRRMMAVGAS